MITVKAAGRNITLHLIPKRYTNGFPALIAFDKYGAPFSKVTTCIQGAPLLEGEYLIKTWSENGWVAQLLDLGLFTDTGKRQPIGYVSAQVWAITELGKEELGYGEEAKEEASSAC